MERIRALERIFVVFLEDRKRDPGAVEDARQWFLGCLVRYDSDALILTLEPVQREIEPHAAELSGESVAKVRADFGFLEATGRPGHDAPPPEPFKLREDEVLKRPTVPETRTDSSRSAMDFKLYFYGLTPSERDAYADRAGTTMRYIQCHLITRRKIPRPP